MSTSNTTLVGYDTAPPTIAPTLTPLVASTGALPVATYTYAYTWLNAYGESTASPSASITASGAIAVAVPMAMADVVACQIYRLVDTLRLVGVGRPGQTFVDTGATPTTPAPLADGLSPRVVVRAEMTHTKPVSHPPQAVVLTGTVRLPFAAFIATTGNGTAVLPAMRAGQAAVCITVFHTGREARITAGAGQTINGMNIPFTLARYVYNNFWYNNGDWRYDNPSTNIPQGVMNIMIRNYIQCWGHSYGVGTAGAIKAESVWPVMANDRLRGTLFNRHVAGLTMQEIVGQAMGIGQIMSLYPLGVITMMGIINDVRNYRTHANAARSFKESLLTFMRATHRTDSFPVGTRTADWTTMLASTNMPDAVSATAVGATLAISFNVPKSTLPQPDRAWLFLAATINGGSFTWSLDGGNNTGGTTAGIALPVSNCMYTLDLGPVTPGLHTVVVTKTGPVETTLIVCNVFTTASTWNPEIILFKEGYLLPPGYNSGTIPGASNADMDVYYGYIDQVIAAYTAEGWLAPRIVDANALGWNANTMIATVDGLHANTKGHDFLTKAMCDTIMDLQPRQGLVYI
jgi:hypothetical protein